MMIAPDLALAKRFLDSSGAPGALLAGVTGSHLYGFPSADSDLDLKGIHVAATADVVSLDPPRTSVDFLGVFEGVEVDYTSHEIAFALGLLLKGNGNILERIVSPLQALAPEPELTALATASVSRRFHRHYRGYFHTTRALAEKERTAKRMLYSYRSALTGIHLLRTGECIASLAPLADEYRFPAVHDLLERKRAGAEKAILESLDPWQGDWPRLEELLGEAERSSRLPPEAPNRGALSAYVVAQRRARF